MNIDEVKEKLTKCMAEAHSDYMEDPVDGEYADGCARGCEYAVRLLENLQEKKVKIPEFIDNDIKYHKKCGYTLQGALRGTFGQGLESDVYYWFYADNGDENFMKYVSAWSNGYEVEKEPKYLVKIKGICQGNQWLDYEVVGDLLYFELNTESEKYKTYFTKQWLKDNWSEYDAYNNAGLLEFEEVENG